MSRLITRFQNEEAVMAFVEWNMQGTELANCNCNWGCPCQFNSLPDKGHCRAHAFIQIDKGHFGDVKLDDLRWASSPPGPAPCIRATAAL
jgi:hypothetical protein